MDTQPLVQQLTSEYGDVLPTTIITTALESAEGER